VRTPFPNSVPQGRLKIGRDAIMDNLSWQSPRSPVPGYPSLAWDHLFDNRGSLQNISILDGVKDRAQDLSKC
jgi:hypothetical protein